MKIQMLNLGCISAATLKKMAAAALVVTCFGAIHQKANAQSAPVKNLLNVKKPASVASEVDKTAEYPGGFPALIKFLSANLKQPAGGVAGKVFATFVVKEDGTLDDIQIIRKLSPANDAEVLRVLKLSPKWKPGIKDGQPVDSQYTLPISFSKA